MIEAQTLSSKRHQVRRWWNDHRLLLGVLLGIKAALAGDIPVFALTTGHPRAKLEKVGPLNHPQCLVPTAGLMLRLLGTCFRFYASVLALRSLPLSWFPSVCTLVSPAMRAW